MHSEVFEFVFDTNPDELEFDGSRFRPRVELNKVEAQRILDRLWAVGYRPTNTEKSNESKL